MKKLLFTKLNGLTIALITMCLGLMLNAQTVSAQNLTGTQVNYISFTDYAVKESVGSEKWEGQILIKDGKLEDIKNLKFTMPKAMLKSIDTDSVLSDKIVQFEQSRVMILPIMGMVHLIGELTIDGVKTMADFQLSYAVNKDQSVTFRGSKLIKSVELKNSAPGQIDVSKIKDDLKLDVDFKVNNEMGIMLAKN